MVKSLSNAKIEAPAATPTTLYEAIDRSLKEVFGAPLPRAKILQVEARLRDYLASRIPPAMLDDDAIAKLWERIAG